MNFLIYVFSLYKHNLKLKILIQSTIMKVQNIHSRQFSMNVSLCVSCEKERRALAKKLHLHLQLALCPQSQFSLCL